MRLLIFLLFMSLVGVYCATLLQDYVRHYKYPTVGVSILVRNKEFSLPYFLSCLENLEYPKDRMYLWIYSDHNSDESETIISEWLKENKDDYNAVYVTMNTTDEYYNDEKNPTSWSTQRFQHVIALREQALEFARQKWADYHFMLDADVFLTNPHILNELVEKKYPIVAPMLQSDGMYSNFWAAMGSNYYYKSTKEYKNIKERKDKGCFEVPMVHTAVLIDMNLDMSDYLTYDPTKIIDYSGPMDDVIIFAIGAKLRKIPMVICNDIIGGYVPIPLDSGDSLNQDHEHVLNVRMIALREGNEVPLTEEMAEFVSYPEPSKCGLDEIYMINLKRRHLRREYMQKCFKELGMSVKHFEAIDAREFDMEHLPAGVEAMSEYRDPYHKRPMKAGEVGCFLSHYRIWEEVAQRNYDKVMVLEDDVYFRPSFRRRLEKTLEDLDDIKWDFVYLGRKSMSESQEARRSRRTVYPHYSYWTIGYLITAVGARKLIRADPLSKMLPVDEFLPIMYDQHPNASWTSKFPERNLLALACDPVIIEPTHYTNEEGYVSDTEDSVIIQADTSGIYRDNRWNDPDRKPHSEEEYYAYEQFVRAPDSDDEELDEMGEPLHFKEEKEFAPYRTEL